MKDKENFYLEQEEPNKSCLLALRQIILEQDKNLSETIKYGMPCFCYHQKMFCYLWTDKKTHEPYVLMVEGNHLEHPKLEQGTRARMKIYRVNPSQDIPVKELKEVLDEGLALYRKGIVKFK